MNKTLEQLMTEHVQAELGRLSLEVLLLRAQNAVLQQPVPPPPPQPPQETS